MDEYYVIEKIGELQDFWLVCQEILLVLSMEVNNWKRKVFGGKI